MNRLTALLGPVKSIFPLGSRGLRTAHAKDLGERGGGRIDFQPGQTYSPWMLNPSNVETMKKRNAVRPPKRADVFKLLKVHPLEMWKDVAFLSQFVTEMGYMKRREETGLTHRNQALVGKAIRRARCAGLLG